VFHSIDNDPYWDETAYYKFSLRQIEDDLEAPSEELEKLCFDVVERVVGDRQLMKRIGIPEYYWDYVANSWQQQDRNLYGRMDFAYDGKGPAKLLEYNADTPTTLYETSIFQWVWLEQAMERELIPAGCDQYNSVHEKLLEALPNLGVHEVLHLACANDSEEDQGTIDYIADCARQAGLDTRTLLMDDIGIDEHGQFTDLDDRLITDLFKLYPWEWIMAEDFGENIARSGARFLEPPWKTILSNKGLLPLLWEMFEGHPNLLPSYFEDDPKASELGDTYIRKPLYSREGLNISVVRDGRVDYSIDGPYGVEGHILQAYNPLPNFDGNFAMTGCWLVASQAAGMCVREDKSLITGDDSRFIPHVIID
jgi:glutathionylspermidine synthase